MTQKFNPLAQTPANPLRCWLCNEKIGLRVESITIDGAPENLHPACAEAVRKHVPSQHETVEQFDSSPAVREPPGG